MGLFSIEHGKLAYRADFAFYVLAVIALAGWLCASAPSAQWLQLAACAVAGLAAWTLIEYGLHRFMLHEMRPFSDWHAEHHRRPFALICTPTLLSASLFASLVFLPTLLASDLWSAGAFTLGVLIGYLAYTVTHHATHHWRASSHWLRQRKHWHALHHHPDDQRACYGVTTGFWDRVFGSTRRVVCAPG